jgi:hypothetical protein
MPYLVFALAATVVGYVITKIEFKYYIKDFKE